MVVFVAIPSLAIDPCPKTFESPITRDSAIYLLETYGRAWETRDPDLITTIFTPDATYHDPKEPKNTGIAATRSYWLRKVVGEQTDIHFKLLNVWIDGTTVVAEWHADFVDTSQNLRIHMDEVAIFETQSGLFKSLREYYKTTKSAI